MSPLNRHPNPGVNLDETQHDSPGLLTVSRLSARVPRTTGQGCPVSLQTYRISEVEEQP